ncbi:MAG: 2-oxoacid:acceptor oxidoreductase family protein [Bacillota bacterium]|jgi:2-oxoacid:acceptor oxidoreductase gamma subunit (pyruvate/2-ketoisovalerate family)
MLEIRIHGRGGQGVVTLAELLAKVALKTGREVQTLPFFGVERRGAAVKAAVRFDSSPIKVRSLSYQTNILVLMHENLLPIGLADGLAPNAVIVSNGEKPLQVNCQQWLVDATDIAIRNNLIFGGEPFINVPMLGALCRVLDIPLPFVGKTINDQWGTKKAAPNIAAAEDAYNAVRQILKEVAANE